MTFLVFNLSWAGHASLKPPLRSATEEGQYYALITLLFLKVI